MMEWTAFRQPSRLAEAMSRAFQAAFESVFLWGQSNILGPCIVLKLRFKFWSWYLLLWQFCIMRHLWCLLQGCKKTNIRNVEWNKQKNQSWLLFCSGINNMVFVLFQCQQYDCQNWHQLVRQREVAWLFESLREYSRHGHINQVSTTGESERLTDKAMIGLGSDKKTKSGV